MIMHVNNIKNKELNMTKRSFQILTFSGIALDLLVADSWSLPKCMDKTNACKKVITDCWQPLWEKCDKSKALPECQTQTQASALSPSCLTFFLNECVPSAAYNPCGGWGFEQKVCSTFVTASKAYKQCVADWDKNVTSPGTLCADAALTMREDGACQ
jgi:hypothetical protein